MRQLLEKKRRSEVLGTLDTYQTNKTFLLKYKRSRQKILMLRDRIEEIETTLYEVQSSKLSSAPKAKNTVPKNVIDDLVIRRNDLVERLNRQKKYSQKLLSVCTEAIDTIPKEIEGRVVEMFFIDNKDLDTIANELHVSFRTARRAYNNGLRTMELHSDGLKLA